jgi:DnaJ-class molecular chaperone
MKPLQEQTHYEVLDVSPNASAYEIGRAHKEACSLYAEHALASYTFFSADEREAVLTRIQEAYSVLSDARGRAAYDLSIDIIRKAGDFPAGTSKSNGGNGNGRASAAETALRDKIRRGAVNGEAKRIARRLAGAGQVTGNDLKLLREAMGLGVEEIEAGSTVGTGLIPTLEADRFQDLPSWLNLRESLMAYAELLQTDKEKIVGGYMAYLTTHE